MRDRINTAASEGAMAGAALIPAVLLAFSEFTLNYLQFEPGNPVRQAVHRLIVGGGAFLLGYSYGRSIGKIVGKSLGEISANRIARRTIAMIEQAQPEQTVPSTET